MNIRNLKLSLTVDLMNLPHSQSPLLFACKVMMRHKVAGKFKGVRQTGSSKIGDFFEKLTFALQFERCTLDLELVSDNRQHQQFIQGFNLTENFA
jgi:hypothetical protein